MDKVLVAIIQILKMEENLDNQKQIVKEMNEFLQIQNAEIEKHCGIVGQLESKLFFKAFRNKILEEKRDHNQKIASLKNQLKDEQKYSDEQDAALGKLLGTFNLESFQPKLIAIWSPSRNRTKC